MKITITAMMLCDLLGGKFTLEACEALCDWFDQTAGNDFAPHIGDIACCYSEIEERWVEEDGEARIIARLGNGNVLIEL